MARKREPSPFEIIGQARLTKVPRDFADRVLAPPTDFEVILAQGFEIASLRRQLERYRQTDDLEL